MTFLSTLFGWAKAPLEAVHSAQKAKPQAGKETTACQLLHVAGCNQEAAGWRCGLLLIHGIDGDPISSWRASTRGSAWFDELATRYAGLAVISLGLPLKRAFRAGEQHVEAVAHEAAALLTQNNVFDRPIVICAYSLGGLVLKRLLIDTSTNADFRRRLVNIRSLVFLGVPHAGSDWAASPLRLAAGRGSSARDDLQPRARLQADIDRRLPAVLRLMPHHEVLTVRETRGPMLGEFHPFVARLPGLRSVRTPLVVGSSSATLVSAQEAVFDVSASHLELPHFQYPGADAVLREIARLLGMAHDPPEEDPLGLGI